MENPKVLMAEVIPGSQTVRAPLTLRALGAGLVFMHSPAQRWVYITFRYDRKLLKSFSMSYAGFKKK